MQAPARWGPGRRLGAAGAFAEQQNRRLQLRLFGFLPGEDQPGFGDELHTLRIFLVTHPRSLKARRAPLRFVSLLLICHRVRLASVADMYSRH